VTNNFQKSKIREVTQSEIESQVLQQQLTIWPLKIWIGGALRGALESRSDFSKCIFATIEAQELFCSHLKPFLKETQNTLSQNC